MKCDFGGRLVADGMEKTDIVALEDAILNTIESPVMDSNEHEEKRYENTITLLIGVSGSGKTHWVESTAFRNPTSVISRDSIVMELGEGKTYNEKWNTVNQKDVDKELERRFRYAVKEKEDIVIDMTNMSRKSRRRWLSSIPKAYTKDAVLFATDAHTIKERNNLRKEEGKYIHPRIIMNMMTSLDIPLYDEFDNIEWVIDYDR